MKLNVVNELDGWIQYSGLPKKKWLDVQETVNTCRRVGLPMNYNSKQFIKFLHSVSYPIKQDSISRYYYKNIMRSGFRWEYGWSKKEKKSGWLYLEKTGKEIEILANQWYDRWVGKFVRFGVVESPLGLNTEKE